MKKKKQDEFEDRNRALSGEEWAKFFQSEVHRYKKHLRAHMNQGDYISKYDLSESLIRRRQQAFLNTVPEINRRYKSPEGSVNLLGETWCSLNLCFNTYSKADENSHLLYAAAIWILDQITQKEGWRQLYRLLPRDEELLDELYLHDAWHTMYDVDLIYSVEYVLRSRNPLETDGDNCKRTLTSEYLAKKSFDTGKEKQNTEPDQNRKNYDALISMIPEEAIQTAVEHFRSYFWEWTDRFFSGAEAFLLEDAEFYKKIRGAQELFDRLKKQLAEKFAKIEKLSREKNKAPSRSAVRNPLLMNPEKSLLDKLQSLDLQGTGFQDTGMGFFAEKPKKTELEKELEECDILKNRMIRLTEEMEETADQANESSFHFKKYQMQMARSGRIYEEFRKDFGGILVPSMEPMKISDPYEMCFALLYLMEANDDLPWLYGAGCGLMEEVIDTLPWGIEEYDEIEDETWDANVVLTEPTGLPKSIHLPNCYDRAYRYKGAEFDFPRNLAQIVYEETGCVLPDNLQVYNDRAKMLGKYGIRGKDAALLLMLMSTLATTRRSLKPLNLEMDVDKLFDGDFTAEPEEEKQPQKNKSRKNSGKGSSSEEPEKLKEEIRRLKTALYASDKENREIKKKLAAVQSAAERERRELADLREYVFNNTENVQEEETVDESKWPYEVQKDTLVFGGHATWVKGMKNLLIGKVRFIDKNLVFDTGIIKHAEALWIQPNALSHPMYYRIMDAARTYGKAVRYFTFASWSKSAEQLASEDLS
ncbi:MAG: hypothetical protein ACSW8H_02780 [bacterium]